MFRDGLPMAGNEPYKDPQTVKGSAMELSILPHHSWNNTSDQESYVVACCDSPSFVRKILYHEKVEKAFLTHIEFALSIKSPSGEDVM